MNLVRGIVYIHWGYTSFCFRPCRFTIKCSLTFKYVLITKDCKPENVLIFKCKTLIKAKPHIISVNKKNKTEALILSLILLLI